MKKKIILITLEAPIPFGGAAARWYYILLTELLKRGHDVSVFSAVSKKEDIQKIKEAFPNTNIKAFEFPKRSGLKAKVETLLKPYSYMFSNELQQEINYRLLEPFDIIHLEQLWTAWLVKDHYKKVMMSVHYLTNIDLEFVKNNSFKDSLTNWLMKRTEKKLLKKMFYIKSCSNRIADKVNEWYPEKRIISVPFAIDKKLYLFSEDDLRPAQKRITLIASMNWYPGASAAFRLLKELWPKLSELNPDCILTIVGWQAESVLSEFKKLKNVEILENVPDIVPYFQASSLLLYAPVRGSGMKIKILEAMLLGAPVVTTSEGVEGLRVTNGKEVFVAEENSELIKKADQLLNDIELQKSMRIAARKFIEVECSASTIVDSIEKYYSEISNN